MAVGVNSWHLASSARFYHLCLLFSPRRTTLSKQTPTDNSISCWGLQGSRFAVDWQERLRPVWLPHLHHPCREVMTGFRVTPWVERGDDSTSADFRLVFCKVIVLLFLVTPTTQMTKKLLELVGVSWCVDHTSAAPRFHLKLFFFVERWQMYGISYWNDPLRGMKADEMDKLPPNL